MYTIYHDGDKYPLTIRLEGNPPKFRAYLDYGELSENLYIDMGIKLFENFRPKGRKNRRPPERMEKLMNSTYLGQGELKQAINVDFDTRGGLHCYTRATLQYDYIKPMVYCTSISVLLDRLPTIFPEMSETYYDNEFLGLMLGKSLLLFAIGLILSGIKYNKQRKDNSGNSDNIRMSPGAEDRIRYLFDEGKVLSGENEGVIDGMIENINKKLKAIDIPNLKTAYAAELRQSVPNAKVTPHNPVCSNNELYLDVSDPEQTLGFDLVLPYDISLDDSRQTIKKVLGISLDPLESKAGFIDKGYFDSDGNNWNPEEISHEFLRSACI